MPFCFSKGHTAMGITMHMFAIFSQLKLCSDGLRFLSHAVILALWSDFNDEGVYFVSSTPGRHLHTRVSHLQRLLHPQRLPCITFVCSLVCSISRHLSDASAHDLWLRAINSQMCVQQIPSRFYHARPRLLYGIGTEMIRRLSELARARCLLVGRSNSQ